MTALTPSDPERQQHLGQLANAAAALNVFTEYQHKRAKNTLRRQRADLALFVTFLAQVRFYAFPVDAAATIADTAEQLMTMPACWRHITHGLIEGFIHWQLVQGYAVGSVNIRLATVRRYAALAFKAGAIDATEHALIKAVIGYTSQESIRVDERREKAAIETRRGAKKAEHVPLSEGQANDLKTQPNTPQGRRDALLLCLLLNQGLRCGEVAALKVSAVNRADGTLTFYREKVDKTQTHILTNETQQALAAYIDSGDCPRIAESHLLRGSRKSGRLTDQRMSARAITARVRDLGAAAGIAGLSAHDCRHFWATYWSQRVHKLPRGMFTLQEAGGWNSLAMPRRYVEAASIANEGMA